jgi:putative holliday junction resolvase
MNMARVLAIDYGRKRTGLAVTDPLGMIATGLDTLPTHEVLVFLKKYIQREKVGKFVVGYPLQMNGQESEAMTYIDPFLTSLKREFPEIDVVMVDERFSSKLAMHAMIEGGMKKSDRRNKAMVDKISAVIILQSYLETIHS